MALKPQEQFKLLKLPLIITAIVFVLVVVGLLVHQWIRPPKEPAVVEAQAPATTIRNLTFFKEGDEYVLYFSLANASGADVARNGEVSLKISRLGTIGMEDGPQFLNELSLIEAKFDVGLNSYRWMEVGGAIFFSQRQLIIPKRISPSLLKLQPPAGQLCKISVRFRDAKVASSELYVERRMLFP